MDDIAYDPNMSQEERLKTWEKEKKGLISDLQSEREKRQGLESRLSSLETRLRPVETVEPVDDKVNRLAKDPDTYIDQRLQPHFGRLKEQVDQIQFRAIVNEAYDWLADQEGTTRRKILNSDVDKDIARIVKDNNLTTIDPMSGTQAAYKIYLQEKEEKKVAEASRSAAINGNSTERPGRPAATGGSRFSAKQIQAMSLDEFNRNFDAIQEAKRTGQISQT